MIKLTKKYINLFISVTLITLFCSLNLYCNTKIVKESLGSKESIIFESRVLKKDTNSPIYLDLTNLNIKRLSKQYVIHVIGCDDYKRNGSVDCTIDDGGQYYVVDIGKKYLLYNDVIKKNKQYVYIYFMAGYDESHYDDLISRENDLDYTYPSYIRWSADADDKLLDCIIINKCNVRFSDLPYTFGSSRDKRELESKSKTELAAEIYHRRKCKITWERRGVDDSLCPLRRSPSFS